jgi:hypothetical protein
MTIHYQVLCAIGLAFVFVGQFQQGVNLANLVVLATGIGVLATRRPWMPALYVIVVAIVQTMIHLERNRGVFFLPPSRAFEPTALLIASGTLLFVGSAYRLHGLTLYVTLPDPRLTSSKAKGDQRPLPPQVRPESALTAEEIAAWLLSIPVFVLAGELVRVWLEQPPPLEGLLHDRFLRVAMLVWLIVIGTLVSVGLFGHWRRAHADPETARMYLEEVVWQEARRDHGRMGRWLAWWRRRRPK